MLLFLEWVIALWRDVNKRKPCIHSHSSILGGYGLYLTTSLASEKNENLYLGDWVLKYSLLDKVRKK